MKDRVYRIVSQVLNIPASMINEDSSPDTVPAWDSLRHLNLVLALEQEFNVQFDDRQTVEMMNVGLVIAILTEMHRGPSQ